LNDQACGGKNFCEHGRLRRQCKVCDSALCL
jgi:hypothetical protein